MAFASAVAASRHAAKRCLDCSRKFASESTSNGRLTGTTATATSLFLAWNLVEGEQIVGSPTTQLEGNFQVRNEAVEVAPLFHHDGYFEPVAMENTLTEYIHTRKNLIEKMKQFQSALSEYLSIPKTTIEVCDRDSDSKEIYLNEDSEGVAKFPSLIVHNVGQEHGDEGREDFHSDNTTKGRIQLNSNSGIPIENDLFAGRLMLILRPLNPDDDPNFEERVDGNSDTTFEIRIQGRFKCIPKGKIYCGGEITEKMSLNIVTKSISKLILQVLSRYFGGNMEYSFGNKNYLENKNNNNSNNTIGTDGKTTNQRRKEIRQGDIPHISFPLRTTLEALIVTKPEQSAPSLEKPFVESIESQMRRKQQHLTNKESIRQDNEDDEWNTTDTYSMSLSASSIDLASWKVVNPCTVDLAKLWGKSALRIVIYEKDEVTNINNYIMAVQLKHLGQVGSMDIVDDDNNYTRQTDVSATAVTTTTTTTNSAMI